MIEKNIYYMIDKDKTTDLLCIIIDLKMTFKK